MHSYHYYWVHHLISTCWFQKISQIEHLWQVVVHLHSAALRLMLVLLKQNLLPDISSCRLPP